MHRVIVIGLTSLMAFGSAFIAGCGKTPPAPEPVRAVKTLVVASASTQTTFDYSGEVRARIESKLSFRVGGKMTERDVNVGDAVKAGQVLARLDPRDLHLGQDVARAAVASAETNWQLAQADFKRYRDLRDQGFIGGAELERRETALKMAQAQYDQARAQAGVQGNQTAYAALEADSAGVVTGVDVEPGMVVSAGMSVLRLAHDGPRDVVFSVPEDKVTLMQSIAAQQGVISVKPWSDAGASLPARIREISASADAATRTFLVKADLGAATGLRLGQTATVSVDAPRLSGITKVPLSALREDHGKSTVWIVDAPSMTTVSRVVRVGAAEGNDAVVTAGLAPGDRVVTAGVHVLSAGQKVKLYADPEAPLHPPSSASVATASASAPR